MRSLLALLFAAPLAFAHYHMLLPNKGAVKTDEEVTFTYQFGHPFEHELFDTAEPDAVYVVAPDGKKTDLQKTLKKTAVGAKKVTGYEFKFTPAQRGDYTFVAVSPAVKVEGEKLPLKDVAKVVLHVQTQNGWDNQAVDDTTAPFDLQPLTRPYGIAPGTAFHLDALLADGKPARRCVVEWERYNPAPPKPLPPDEQITRTGRTSRTGTAVVTLGEAGWWGITANLDGEKQRHRCTLWVWVDEKAK